MIVNAVARMRPFFSRFRRDDDAVVAIQVVIFSVMLLTSAGLVIDFGRAYSAHSQMQSFVDKAALAAAAELDGGDDALERATAAAVAIAQSSTFTEEDSEFAIATPLTFLLGNPADDTGTFSEDVMSTLTTSTAAYATHVYVEAEARSIRLALLSVGLNNDTTNADGTEKTTSINLSAYAVARMQISYCGELSTMVMCNPFENDSASRSFAEIMEGNEGTRMFLTTDLQPGLDVPRALSTNDGAIRVGLFKNPRHEIGADIAGVCDDIGLTAFQAAAYDGNPNISTSTDPWSYPSNDEDLERLRDTCLLATIDSQMQCIGGEVLIKPAEPDTITTALNTLFDIWDAPMDRVLTQPVTTDRAFSPDYVANHGHLTRAEYIEYIENGHIAEADEDMARSAAQVAALEARGPAFASYAARAQESYDNAAASRAEWVAVLAAYPDNITNTAARRNHMKGDGYGGAWGPMIYADCMQSDPESCSPYPYMALPFTESTSDGTATGWRMGPLSAAVYEAPEAEATEPEATEGTAEPASTATPDTDIISLGPLSSDSSITGWRISNYTDHDLTGRLGFETNNKSVIFQLPANSEREYQVQVNDTAVITWTSEVELDLYLITDEVDNTLAYSGVGTPWYDIEQGRVPSFVEYFSTYHSPYMTAYGFDLDNPSTSFEWDIVGSHTLYDGYTMIERQTSELLEYAASNGPGEDGEDIRSLPEHFQFTSNTPSAEQSVERRRQNVALVNCQALTTPTSHSGTSDAYSGAYVAELEAVVELFFTGPVDVQTCADTVGSDPSDQMDCWNSDIELAYIPVEYLGAADPADPSVQEYINYAVLVH